MDDEIFYLATQLLWRYWGVNRIGMYQTTYFFENDVLMNIYNSNFGNEFENSDEVGESIYYIVITNDEQIVASDLSKLKDKKFCVALNLSNYPINLKKNYNSDLSEPSMTIWLDKVVNGDKFVKWAESNVNLKSWAGTD